MLSCDPPRVYDAVVVGSGPGGLATARRLASEGLRVLVLERDARAGGTVLTYSRSGFLLPRGPLGYAHVPLVRETLISLASEPPHAHYRLRYLLFTEEGAFPLSLPFGELASRLARTFPGEGGLGYFFQEMRRMYGQWGNGLPPSGVELDDKWKDPPSRLAQLVHHPRLRRLLLGMGSPEPYAAPLLASSWNLVAEVGVFRPGNGMEELAGTLLEGATIYDYRSTGSRIPPPGDRRFNVLTSCPVEEILLDEERVKGVRAGGSFFPCRVVISNADAKTTLLRLLPAGALDRETRGFLLERKLSPSQCQVCLRVDGKRVDLSPFLEAEVLLEARPPEGVNKGGEVAFSEKVAKIMRHLGSALLEVIVLPSPGEDLSKKALLLRASCRWEDFLVFRPTSGRRHPSYAALKGEIARTMVERASALLPGLREAATILDVATPLTFEERGGRFQGAVAGWSWTEKPSLTWGEELVVSPVEGLYLAGHQAFSTLVSGGIPTALLTGIRAAEYALAGEGPRSLPPF